VDEVFGKAFSGGLLAAMIMLIAYQVFMLIWAKKTVGKVPTTVKVLRGVNLALLAAGTVLIIVGMARS
jgi:hypothetical protein